MASTTTEPLALPVDPIALSPVENGGGHVEDASEPEVFKLEATVVDDASVADPPSSAEAPMSTDDAAAAEDPSSLPATQPTQPQQPTPDAGDVAPRGEENPAEEDQMVEEEEDHHVAQGAQEDRKRKREEEETGDPSHAPEEKDHEHDKAADGSSPSDDACYEPEPKRREVEAEVEPPRDGSQKAEAQAAAHDDNRGDAGEAEEHEEEQPGTPQLPSKKVLPATEEVRSTDVKVEE